jgi:hypothetical protein
MAPQARVVQEILNDTLKMGNIEVGKEGRYLKVSCFEWLVQELFQHLLLVLQVGYLASHEGGDFATQS